MSEEHDLPALLLPDGKVIPLGNVAVFRVEFGDVLFLSLPPATPHDECERLRNRLAAIAGISNERVLVLPEGANVEVIRPVVKDNGLKEEEP